MTYFANYPLKKKTTTAPTTTTGVAPMQSPVPAPKVKTASHAKKKFRAPKLKLVRIDWMENRDYEPVGQYSCSGCKQIFYFASDRDGVEAKPGYCPMCGHPRKQK